MNFYVVLGISRDADDEAIRRAYRMLARRYHPDQGVGSSAEKFRQVREAYETLIDPASRRSYDLSLQRATYPRAIRIETTVAQSRPLYREHPGVFGRFASGAESSGFEYSTQVEDVFTNWFRLLFCDSEWPW
jgi:DnaJ-class molecular chaperone